MRVSNTETNSRRGEPDRLSLAPSRAAGTIDRLLRGFEARDEVGAGMPAPDFRLPDRTGGTVSLYERLEDGPVVLTFYSSGGCPDCRAALRAYQRRLPSIQAAGGRLVAVAPERPAALQLTAAVNALEFDMLSDDDLRVAEQFGVLREAGPSPAAAAAERALVATTFVIDTGGRIAAAGVEPDEALSVLRTLRRRSAATASFGAHARVRTPAVAYADGY